MAELKEPVNENYAATVVAIEKITPLEGSDNIVGTPLLGLQAIVSKDTKVGDIGIVFPAESQISQEFAYQNNLHQHGNLNKDEGSKGYLGDNRRVRAIRLRGNRSNSIFMPLSSLSYIKKFKPEDLKVGDTFDELYGHPICNKFILKVRATNRVEKNKLKFVRVDKMYLPEHYDSDMWYKHEGEVNDKERLVITQKLHGTSIRIGNTIVTRKLKLKDKLAKKLGVKVQDTEYDYVFGSRKVIKDLNNPNQNHFYSTDIWTEEGKKLEGSIPENFLVYGELVGWTPDGAAIQKNYTYGIDQGKCELYVYRVAFVNVKGFIVDLSWMQLKEFCRDRGLKHVPELGFVRKNELDVEKYLDKRFADQGYGEALPLDGDKSLVDEGICIRVEGIAPYILKAKSPVFYEHETKMNDEEVVDLETQESQSEE